MECPRDGSGLSAERYEGEIELDRCAACRGTWLDTGELEAIQKTVERDHSKHVDAPMQSVKEISKVAATEENQGFAVLSRSLLAPDRAVLRILSTNWPQIFYPKLPK
jgi:Zn-finger nucleic acid-binding protein